MLKAEIRRQGGMQNEVPCGCYGLTPAELALMWQTAANGIALLAHRCYRPGMKTLTLKLPDGLLGWLEHEAKRARQPKSALVREILQQHQQHRHQSALDLGGGLVRLRPERLAPTRFPEQESI